MKQILLCAVCWLALFGSANATPIVNNNTGAGTIEDTVAYTFFVTDSIGNLKRADSFFVAVFSPNGDSVYAAGYSRASAEIKEILLNNTTGRYVYQWRESVADIDGATPLIGDYTIVLIAIDTLDGATAAFLDQPFAFTFQLEPTLAERTALAVPSGGITSGSFAAGAIDVSAIAAGAITVSEAPSLDAAISTRGTSTLTAADNIGINWADVSNPTTAVGLSGTTVSTTQAVASVSGAVGSVTGAVGSVGTGGITAATIADGALDSNTFTIDAKGMIAKHADSTANQAIKIKTDFLPSATAGATGGVFIAGTNAATTITTALTTTFTGNLTGSVGSVTGAVGSVTGNVGGNVVGSVASVTAAVPVNFSAITGTLDAAEIGTDAITATKIAAASITVSEAPNLDAAVSTRSTFAAATDSVLVRMGAFNSALDNDTTLVAYLRAILSTISAGSEIWTAAQRDSIINRVLALRDSVNLVHAEVVNVNGSVPLTPGDTAALATNITNRIHNADTTGHQNNLGDPSKMAYYYSRTGASGGGGSSCGDSLGYTRTIVVIDTSAVPDVAVNGFIVNFNNQAQSGIPYQVTTNNLGRASLGLNAGNWVRLHADPRYLPETDSFTVAGVGIDTMRLCQTIAIDSDTLTTTVAFYVKKPDGTPNDSVAITIELLPVYRDSLMRVGNNLLAASYAQMQFRGDADGRALIHMYPNSIIVNDSCYRATTRNRFTDKIIEAFRFAVPAADSVVYINNLSRWK